MNFIWRFYRDQERLWRWQRLSTDKSVIAESPARQRAKGLANAKLEGYVFEPHRPGCDGPQPVIARPALAVHAHPSDTGQSGSVRADADTCWESPA
jgi:hypothetical protein